jgi:hypothetical protein
MDFHFHFPSPYFVRLVNVLKHWQAAQKTERESEIAMCDRMQMYNIITLWSWTLLERSLVLWTLDSFPAFYEARRFNTEFTRALHLSPSWARPIQSTSPHRTSTRCILILSNHLRLGVPSWLFPFWLSHQQPIRVPLLPHSCYMPRLSHPRRLHYCNYTWRRVQIMKLFVILYRVFHDFRA